MVGFLNIGARQAVTIGLVGGGGLTLAAGLAPREATGLPELARASFIGVGTGALVAAALHVRTPAAVQGARAGATAVRPDGANPLLRASGMLEITSQEARARLAREIPDAQVKSGRGNSHQWTVTAANGAKISVPDHPGDLSKKVERSILGFLDEHGDPKLARKKVQRERARVENQKARRLAESSSARAAAAQAAADPARVTAPKPKARAAAPTADAQQATPAPSAVQERKPTRSQRRAGQREHAGPKSLDEQGGRYVDKKQAAKEAAQAPVHRKARYVT